MFAHKFSLALAVGLLAVAALTASAAGVARIDQDGRHAGQPSLVLHEYPELKEAPVTEPAAEAFGYILLFVGKDHHLADVRGYAYEHRIVAEQAIGRQL